MKMTEIIKDSFLFPSKNSGRYAIYLLLTSLMVLFAIGGIITCAFGILYAENYLTGGMYLIISMLIAFIIAGYHIKVLKSGIDLDDNVPSFKLYEDFMTGFDNFVVLIFYFLIPALIVVLVGLDTNIFVKSIDVVRELLLQTFNVYIMGSPVDIAVSTISFTLNNFVNSLATTLTVALVLFVIFSFIQSIAEARLANTGSLKEALNIFETLKDIKRIGIFRVILVIVLIEVIIIGIEFILAIILNSFPFLLTTFCIIITPYFILVTQRAIGLLYSDIV